MPVAVAAEVNDVGLHFVESLEQIERADGPPGNEFKRVAKLGRPDLCMNLADLLVKPQLRGMLRVRSEKQDLYFARHSRLLMVGADTRYQRFSKQRVPKALRLSHVLQYTLIDLPARRKAKSPIRQSGKALRLPTPSTQALGRARGCSSRVEAGEVATRIWRSLVSWYDVQGGWSRWRRS